ncbi:MAG: pantetheine-phosphate adenylyltransferase [Streptococcaceae bacterium]|jgi:pantetheine-phosphate adenylyltransferase|nr:pantetheine-phosphate adenylyltransferase [Streptococcaceae bacterium]
MTEKIGLFTGSFDPVTNGHLDIIARASKLFDKLYVGIFDNPNKNYLFSLSERTQLLQEDLDKFGNVELLVHQPELTVRIAAEKHVTALVRAVRTASDFDYEANMIYFNREMTGVETVLLVAQPELAMISSSRVRELSGFKQDVSRFVPANVNKSLEEKFGRN